MILIAGGVIQNFAGFEHVTSITGSSATIPGGPVASQEAIKELGTNGGGFFNANSAHPFENPTAWTNLFEIFLFLLIPFSLPRTFGRMVGDRRQGVAIVITMGIFWLGVERAAGLGRAQRVGNGAATGHRRDGGEGGPLRDRGVHDLRGVHDPDLDRRRELDARQLHLARRGGDAVGHDARRGRPGGVGAGLYGILVLAVIAVFVAGLMVGRTPEYLGKKIGPREMKLASLYILTTPALVLLGTGLSFAIPGVRQDVEKTSIWNPGTHGFSEVLYAFTSAATTTAPPSQG